VSFNVTPDAYARFMGQYSEPLAAEFVELSGLRAGQRALDVGCGPGALTARLVELLGEPAVVAVDPSPPFVAAIRARFPGVDVRTCHAEQLPFADDSFDAAAAQLVVHFMTDPVRGLREMGRVVRPGGTVTACVWDNAGGGSPLSLFWESARDVDPVAVGEADLPGSREGQLGELSEAAGLRDIESGSMSVRVHFATFADWWEPYTLGVGPAGAHVARLDDGGRAALRDACEQRLPEAPFDVVASAWWVRARAADPGALGA
jgi:SAM-dependent methyltransferase